MGADDTRRRPRTHPAARRVAARLTGKERQPCGGRCVFAMVTDVVTADSPVGAQLRAAIGA